jgi:hypothetical protein
MNVNEYLEKVAYVAECKMEHLDDKDILDAYYSKFDDSFMTFIGFEENMKFLADREITENLTHGVGFSPKDKKWYGWSHRAIFGFKIGSTCKKGDCHYIGSTLKEQRDAAIDFWKDESHKNVRCEGIIERNGDEFFIIEWDNTDDIPNKKLRNTDDIPNKKLCNKISGAEYFINPLGRGEWIARTMEDAKQMAVDFNKGVS